MKVRMFSNPGNIQKLEGDINDWLIQNPVKILQIKQSYVYDGKSNICYPLISIWYVETNINPQATH